MKLVHIKKRNKDTETNIVIIEMRRRYVHVIQNYRKA